VCSPNLCRRGLSARSPDQVARASGHAGVVPVLCLLLLAAFGLMTFGCYEPTANLVISAPASAVSGTPFTVIVSAKVNGTPDTIFDSLVHFTSSDSAAVTPNYYQFTEADAGSHTFTNGVTFNTPGNQTVTATSTMTSYLSATANVTVSAAP
jgi:hypothetical protein